MCTALRVLAGEAPTQVARALGELGAVLLPHTPGNEQATGKIERWNRFFQERLLADGPYPSVEALDAALKLWLAHYNARHQHRVSYTLPPEPNLVAFNAELRTRVGQTVRVWNENRLVAELPHGSPPRPEGLSVDQILEEVLPRLEPKAGPLATAGAARGATISGRKGGRTAAPSRS